jgi:hypothetical protein
MKYLREVTLAVLALNAPLFGSEMAERLDLERLLRDTAGLNKLLIEYEAGDNTVLFVNGGGTVVKQGRSWFKSNALVPTCTGRVGRDDAEELVRALISWHFFDLPTRSYYYATASDEEDFWRALKVHSITIDDGQRRTYRQFAEGAYQERKETIPANFTAIEDVLRHIEKSAIGGNSCHIAPGIKLPPSDPPKVTVPQSPS